MSEIYPYIPAAILSVMTSPQYVNKEQKEGFSMGSFFRNPTMLLETALASQHKNWSLGKRMICILCIVIFIILAIALSVALFERSQKPPAYHRDPIYRPLPPMMVNCHRPRGHHYDEESLLNSEGNAAAGDIVYRPFNITEYSDGAYETLNCHMKPPSNPRLLHWARKHMKKKPNRNRIRSQNSSCTRDPGFKEEKKRASENSPLL